MMNGQESDDAIEQAIFGRRSFLFLPFEKDTHTMVRALFAFARGGRGGRAGGRARGSHVESEWRLNGTEEAFFFTW